MNSNPDLFAAIRWDKNGLVPVIAQDSHSQLVLMQAWMNRDALEQTLAGGEAVYWSRSRKKLWHKGEQSGCTQRIRQICLDCDGDTLLLQVEQRGSGACHTGRPSCFFRSVVDGHWQLSDAAAETAEEQPR